MSKVTTKDFSINTAAKGGVPSKVNDRVLYSNACYSSDRGLKHDAPHCVANFSMPCFQASTISPHRQNHVPLQHLHGCLCPHESVS